MIIPKPDMTDEQMAPALNNGAPSLSIATLLSVLTPVLLPLLLGLRPILFLYSRNIQYYVFSDITRSVLVMIAATLVLWALLSWRLCSSEKGALVVAIIWVFMFTCGPLVKGMETRGIPAVFALLLWGVLLVVSLYLLARTRRPLRAPITALTVTVLLLCALPLITIVNHHLKRESEASAPSVLPVPPRGAPTADSGLKPNIYFILVDGYPRADVLQHYLNFDDTPFLRIIKRHGFTVIPRSRSNYSQTALSVASIFNMTYLDDVARRTGLGSTDRYPLRQMILNSAVVNRLRAHGYRTAAFASSYNYTQMTNFDEYLAPTGLLTEFEGGLVQMTPLFFLGDLRSNEAYTVRNSAEYIFDHLSDPVRTDEPVFVFAHFFACHEPYVFGPRGGGTRAALAARKQAEQATTISQRLFQQTVADQLSYINIRLEESLPTLLHTKRPTIVLLQADHGINLHEMSRTLDEETVRQRRMENFSAYYLPGEGKRDLYPTMSPVNLFRVLFNHYFGDHYPLLADHGYYSYYEQPYRFIQQY